MKKLNFILAAILFALMSTTFINCNKETELTPVEIDNDAIILQRILDFKQKVENPEMLKSDQTMSIDSAVWYIEAALNYTYCLNTNEPNVNDFIEDSISVSVTSYNNKLLFNEIISTYNEICQKVDSLKTNNNIDLIDVYYIGNKTVTKVIYNKKSISKSKQITHGFVPTNFFSAADIIDKSVNNNIRYNTPSGYYTDVQTTSEYKANSLFRNPNSNDPCYEYYYLFYEQTDYYYSPFTYSSTLTTHEMNFYYSGAFTAANIVKQQLNLVDKRFIRIDLTGDLMPNGENWYPIFHWAKFTYGIFHETFLPPTEEN